VLERLEDRALLTGLSIAAENQRPGSPPSQWDISGSGDSTLQGFATDISVNEGQTVSFKISDTTGALYHIDIYRMGYYQGNGARLAGFKPDCSSPRIGYDARGCRPPLRPGNLEPGRDATPAPTNWK
jgi:hypothetical protein